MLQYNTSRYWDFVTGASNYLHLPIFTGILNIPREATQVPLSRLLDRAAWLTRDCHEISQSVCRRLGHRNSYIPITPEEADAPTRTLFLTLDYPLRYDEIEFFGELQPQLFLGMPANQQVDHYHIAMIFPFYFRSAALAAAAMKIYNYINCGPIKTSWKIVCRYLEGQHNQKFPPELVRNDKRPEKWRNMFSAKIPQLKIDMDANTGGWPGFYDGRTPRRPWMWVGAHQGDITVEDCHRFLPEEEIYHSPVVGETGPDYIGQAAVVAHPFNTGKFNDVRVPIVTMFVARE
jgi:hypothetical protein